MANRTVIAENLREGSTIFVSGKLAYSRLARLIAGQELADSIARQKAQGRKYPTSQPHTTVTISDAQVLFADANNPTPEETFIAESLYVSKSGENAGKTCYSIDNIGQMLPPVFARNDDGSYSQVILERELANGLDVTLVLNVFKPRSYEKRGIGLSKVLVNEEIRYYSSNDDLQALAARGIIINGPVTPVTGTAEANSSESGMPAGTVVENGLPMPGPAPVAPQAPAAGAAGNGRLPGETDEQYVARLQAELAQVKQAQVQPAPAGDSPFDPVPGSGNPWDTPAGIRYQG